jgi:hypothetical protein
MLRCNWNLAVGWVEAPHVGEAEASCCGNVESETSIMVGSRAYVVAVRGMGRAPMMLVKLDRHK